jgi:hypothetical protein
MVPEIRNGHCRRSGANLPKNQRTLDQPLRKGMTIRLRSLPVLIFDAANLGRR